MVDNHQFISLARLAQKLYGTIFALNVLFVLKDSTVLTVDAIHHILDFIIDRR